MIDKQGDAMRTGLVVGTLLLAALTAACSSEQVAPAVRATTASDRPATGAASGDTTASPTGVPSGAVDYDTGERVDTPSPEPVWDDASREAAGIAASTVLALFARPDLPYATWWAELAPALSAQAQLDYADTDPAQVPAHGVTGAAALVDTSSALVAVVEVPTDIGTYTVVLSREGANSPWLAERLTPPAS